MTEEQKALQLDWEAATRLAYTILTVSAPAAQRVHMRSGGAKLDGYWAEPIQNAALRAVARSHSGVEALPATTNELAASLARYAKFFDDNRRGWKRRQLRLFAENADRIRERYDASHQLDLLEQIIAKDLFEKFVARLFDALDLDARKVLELWLGEGVEYSDTQGFMKRLELNDPSVVHNIKRRIRYRAHIILTELTGSGDRGEVQ